RQLLLREVRIDERERHAVEREIPRRVPRVLPLVRHRDDVGVVEVRPLAIASVLPIRWRRGLPAVAVEPLLDDVVVILLGPEQAGEGLTRDVLRVARQVLRDHAAVELVGLGDASLEHVFERVPEGRAWIGGEAQPDRARAARWYR